MTFAKSSMRKLAVLPVPRDELQSCVLYATATGTYVFLRRAAEDGPAFADLWFADEVEAEAHCLDEYGIRAADWQSVDDPLPGCRHDWIAPVPIARDRS